MDRHAPALRSRIIASVAAQIGATFVVVVAITVTLMQWQTDESLLVSMFPALVIAQAVALGRVGYAMRNNPLNYRFVRHFIETPFRYRVSRFVDEVREAHDSARTLPGFLAVATIRDDDASPAPVFDVLQDPSCLVAASVSRASGAIALISLLRDGRLLVTDSRLIPPHESLVMNPAEKNTAVSLISAHRRAMLQRGDVVRIDPSAHQIVLRSLLIEYEAYRALGPWLSPFLLLESQSRAYLRLGVRLREADAARAPAQVLATTPVPAQVVATTPVPLGDAPGVPDHVGATTQLPLGDAERIAAPLATHEPLHDAALSPAAIDALIASVEGPSLESALGIAEVGRTSFEFAPVPLDGHDEARRVEASSADPPLAPAPPRLSAMLRASESGASRIRS